MRKRLSRSRWEMAPAAARSRTGSTVDTGIPVTGGVCHKPATLPLFPARTAPESSP